MTKTTLLKSATLLFSFGMMGLFVAYRMGAFEKKVAPETETSAPLDQTVLSKDKTNEPDSLKDSQTVSSPVAEILTKDDPPINLTQPANLDLTEDWHIMAGSKSMVITDLQLTMPKHKLTSAPESIISLDSIKKTK